MSFENRFQSLNQGILSVALIDWRLDLEHLLDLFSHRSLANPVGCFFRTHTVEIWGHLGSEKTQTTSQVVPVLPAHRERLRGLIKIYRPHFLLVLPGPWEKQDAGLTCCPRLYSDDTA